MKRFWSSVRRSALAAFLVSYLPLLVWSARSELRLGELALLQLYLVGYAAVLAGLVGVSVALFCASLARPLIPRQPPVVAAATSLSDHLRAELREGWSSAREVAIVAFAYGWAATPTLALLLPVWETNGLDASVYGSQSLMWLLAAATLGGLASSLLCATLSLLWRLAGPWLYATILSAGGSGALALWLSYQPIWDSVVAALTPSGSMSGGGGPGVVIIALLWILLVLLLVGLAYLVVFGLAAFVGLLASLPFLLTGIVLRAQARAKARQAA